MIKKYIKSIFILTVFSIFLLYLPIIANSQVEKPYKLVVGYATIAGAQSPLWVTEGSGMFDKNALDVKLVFIEGGTKAMQAMIGGSTNVAVGAGPEVITGIAGGAEIVIIAGMLNTMPYFFITSKDITKPEELKGKKMAISRYGSSSHFAVNFALKKWGLIAEKDVAIIQIGSTPTRFAALSAGAVHGTVVSPPETLLARKQGFNILTDLISLGMDYLGNAVAVSPNLIKNNPDVVQRFIKSLIDGIHFLKTNKQESLKIIARFLRTGTGEAVEETYNQYALRMTPKKPYPNINGIKAILEEMGKKDPRAKNIKAENIVDIRFIKNLDESRYIDSLYK